MAQTFHVLRCYSCKTFQVHQKKISTNKWTCKLCGEKQSIKKVYGEGSGADCRRHVQKCNLKQGELKEEDALGQAELSCNSTDSQSVREMSSGVVVSRDLQKTNSRWDRYLESCNNMESEDLQHTTSKEKFEKISKRPQPYTNRKRFASTTKTKANFDDASKASESSHPTSSYDTDLKTKLTRNSTTISNDRCYMDSIDNCISKNYQRDTRINTIINSEQSTAIALRGGQSVKYHNIIEDKRTIVKPIRNVNANVISKPSRWQVFIDNEHDAADSGSNVPYDGNDDDTCTGGDFNTEQTINLNSQRRSDHNTLPDAIDKKNTWNTKHVISDNSHNSGVNSELFSTEDDLDAMLKDF